MLVEWSRKKKTSKKSVMKVDGKLASKVTVNVLPGGVNIKYILEDDPNREYDRLFSSSTIVTKRENMQVIDLKDEQPSGDWIWERQVKRGVIA